MAKIAIKTNKEGGHRTNRACSEISCIVNYFIDHPQQQTLPAGTTFGTYGDPNDDGLDRPMPACSGKPGEPGYGCAEFIVAATENGKANFRSSWLRSKAKAAGDISRHGSAQSILESSQASFSMLQNLKIESKPSYKATSSTPGKKRRPGSPISSEAAPKAPKARENFLSKISAKKHSKETGSASNPSSGRFVLIDTSDATRYRVNLEFGGRIAQKQSENMSSVERIDLRVINKIGRRRLE